MVDTDKLRVCLVSDYSGRPDEGVKKVTRRLADHLASQCDLKRVHLAHVFWPGLWREMVSFRPHLIHSVPGPTLFVSLAVRALKTFCPGSRTLVSATHPLFPHVLDGLDGVSSARRRALRSVFHLLRPDLLLYQSYRTEQMVGRWGWRAALMPNGVDTERLRPASVAEKSSLRSKYGIPEDQFVALHVGSITERRNVEALTKLVQQDSRVVVVGSTSVRLEKEVHLHLERAGCQVWARYVPEIWELYAVSNCYVFPTTDRRASIEMPLSVLEAMACNLPVVSTRYGALPRFFDAGNGLIYADSDEELVAGVETIRTGRLEVNTREKVLPYSWDAVLETLDGIYAQLTLLPGVH